MVLENNTLFCCKLKKKKIKNHEFNENKKKSKCSNVQNSKLYKMWLPSNFSKINNFFFLFNFLPETYEFESMYFQPESEVRWFSISNVIRKRSYSANDSIRIKHLPRFQYVCRRCWFWFCKVMNLKNCYDFQRHFI